MAQFPENETSAHFVGRASGRVAHRRSAVSVAQIGTAQVDGDHGTVLSYSSDRMELGAAKVHAQNQNSRPQR